jgi:hypothetical protein
LIVISRFSWRLFLYEDKSSTGLERVLRGYTGFHGYNESIGFFVSIRIL